MRVEISVESVDGVRVAARAGAARRAVRRPVRDQETRTRLGELYLVSWAAHRSRFLGPVPLESAPRWVRDADCDCLRLAHLWLVATASR